MINYVKETKDWCRTMPYPFRDRKEFTVNNMLRVLKELDKLRYENDVQKGLIKQYRQIALRTD